MTQNPAPGWYPDPQDPARSRWWDGGTWTEQTAPGTVGGPAAAGGPLSGAPGSYGQPYGHGPGGGPPVGSTTPYVRGLPGGGGPQPTTMASHWRRSGDRTALLSMAIAVGYVAIAIFAHIWFIGILPLLLASRAVRLRSPLGWVAVAVGVAALIAGIVLAAHHQHY